MNGHKIQNQNSTHFITCTVVGWVDVFTREEYKKIVLDSLRYCQDNKGLVINAFVIMSNHIHLIGYARDSFSLSDIIRDFKKFTSKTITQKIKDNPSESRKEWMLKLFEYYGKFNKNVKTYQFWQNTNQPVELVSPKWLAQKLAYIHLNPVRSGLVDKAESYIYSSATNYLGLPGILDIEILDFGAMQGYVDS